MIRVSASPGRLCVEGHAGSAAFGHDLVCAGASMLVWTLAAQLEGRQDARVRLGAGLAEIRCAPDEPALAFAAAGLRLLAERFPEFVRLEEGQTARKNPVSPKEGPVRKPGRGMKNRRIAQAGMKTPYGGRPMTAPTADSRAGP